MKSLIKRLEEQVTESESNSFEVGEQRERNHRYVSLQPLGNEKPGRSQYIDPSVLDAVESKKALFDETFLSNRQTVMFKSGGNQQPGEADAKTAYAMKTLRRNNHYKLFRDGWHDAFVAKRETVIVFWKDETKDIVIDVTGAPPQALPQIVMSQGEPKDVDMSKLQRGPNGALSGQLTLTVDDSHVGIKLLQPEMYFRDPLATYPEDAQWNTYVEDVPRGTLILEGFDEDQVMELKSDYRFRATDEDSSRKQHDSSSHGGRAGIGSIDRYDTQQTVTLYRTWTWLNLHEIEELQYGMEESGGEANEQDNDRSGGKRFDLNFDPPDEIALYEIHWAAGEILRHKDGYLCIYQCEKNCFFEWTEIKISHAEHGMCTSDVMAHTQKTASVLKRLIIDNQQMRNNTRYEAAIGALKNPRDLLDNKIGGVIWSRQVGSVAPLATPELSPLTFNVLEMLKSDGERRDGYSALGKGMNDDAIRYQNADSMVERLTNAGTRRPMKACRDWAQTFLIPVCQHIIHLAMRHDKSQDQMEVRGKVIPIVPSQWSDDALDMDIAVALTPEEGKDFAGKLLSMHTLLTQDPTMAPLYGLAQKHALLDSVFDAMGVSDSTPYMQRPDSPQVQQAVQQNAEMGKMMAQRAMKMEDDNMDLLKSGDKRLWEEFRWKQTTEVDKANREHDQLDQDITSQKKSDVRDTKQLVHQVEFDNEKLEIDRLKVRKMGGGQ